MRRLALVVLTILTITLGYGCKKNPAAPSGQNNTFSRSIDVDSWDWDTITVTKTGTMTVTLTWPSSSVDLDLYLTDSSCDAYPPDHCTILERSDAESGTQERVARNVTAGEMYHFHVDNWATTSSNWTVTVSIP